MQNPYRRLRELCGVTQVDFAKKHGFSRTTVTFIETGQLADLSADMVNAIVEESHQKGISIPEILASEYNGEGLMVSYRTWQTNQRVQVASEFRIAPRQGTIMPSISPMGYLVVDSTVTAQKFCKKLKVPNSALKRYITGATVTMPKAIHRALTEIRYPYLDELIELQTAWANR